MFCVIKRMDHSAGKAVVLPKTYAFCIAGYFPDMGLVCCGKYFDAKKDIVADCPVVVYMHWVHGFGSLFLVGKISAYRSCNGDDDSIYAYERLLCCDGWVVENPNLMAKELGTLDPQRDERIPIGPTDV